MDVLIRKAKKSELPEVLHLIKELAAYEQAPNEVTNTVEDMIRDGYSEHPVFSVIVAANQKDQSILGIALYYIGYSTWKGRILYLDDLIITEAYRRKGIGQQLMAAIIDAAKKERVKMIKWQVLDWNTPALEFYKKIHVHFDADWINCTFSELQIHNYPITHREII